MDQHLNLARFLLVALSKFRPRFSSCESGTDSLLPPVVFQTSLVAISFSWPNPIYLNRSTYFIVHILLIGAIIFIPGGRPKPSHEAKAVNGAVTSQQARQEVQTESNKDVSVTRIANNNALFRHSRSAKLS